MTKIPKVSVLMPVYNGERYLAQAVESILNQTFTDFEFVILDDCSTDSTPAILDRYTDSRIVRLRNDTNLGITRSLNRLLDSARGEYLARMDADDIAYPDRLAKQVAQMDADPQLGLLGTRYVIVDEEGKSIYGEPSPPDAARVENFGWSLLWMTAVQHPTAMMRRSVLDRHNLRYDPEYETAEDYDLWTRIGHVSRVGRLHDPCLDYRVFSQSISNTRRAKQIETHHRIMHRELCAFMDEALPENVTRYLLEMFVPGIPQSDVSVNVLEASQTLLRIRDRFVATGIHPDAISYIDQVIRRYLRKALYRAHTDCGRAVLWRLRMLILSRYPKDFAELTFAFVGARLKRYNYFKDSGQSYHDE